MVLPSFTDDELRQIPVVQAGSRLMPGATYLDLRALRGREFSAPVEAYAGLDGWYVAKVDVAPALWNRLLDGPRTPSAPEGREPARRVQEGEVAERGGRERSERRGSSPMRSVQTPARHHRARGH
jgi:hypothetical protein